MTDIKKKAEEWYDKSKVIDDPDLEALAIVAYLAGAKERDKFWGEKVKFFLNEDSSTESSDKLWIMIKEALEES